MFNSKEISLTDAELDVVIGGATIVGQTLGGQSLAAIGQELTAAYLASHPIQLPVPPASITR